MSRHLERAWKLYELKRDRDAIAEAREHLAVDPENSEAYRLIAHAAARSKDAPAAIAAASEAIHLAPHSAYTHFSMAVAQEVAGNLKYAECHVREAIALNNQVPDFYAFWASILCKRHRFKRALAASLEGRTLDSRNEDLLYTHARALWGLFRTQDAQSILDEGLREHPNSSNLHALRGIMLVHGGQWTHAQELLHESLRLNPENEWAANHFELSKGPQFSWSRAGPVLLLSAATVLLLVLMLLLFVAIEFWMRSIQPVDRIDSMNFPSTSHCDHALKRGSSTVGIIRYELHCSRRTSP